MAIEALIPITLFICIYLAIKAVVDARARRHMLQSNGSEDMLRTLIEGFDWTEASPGLFAILLAATGLGNLAAYYIARRAR